MNLSALLPPTLVARLLDDIGAIADAARTLPRRSASHQPARRARRATRAVDNWIDTLRSDLAPLGEPAHKIPGIG